jgi:predicted site-specific integrase-resolvase
MKLSAWARLKGISYGTALRWVRDGQMPVPFERAATGTILVHDSSQDPRSLNPKTALYARVSGSGQKADLDAQVGRLSLFSASNKLQVVEIVAEIGSGLNGHRPKLMKLLSNPAIGVIVVEHRDRLMRFGCEYVEAALKAQGRQLVVVDQGEMKDDLVQDMIEVLTSFCARLYGRRLARNKARKALKAVEQ